MHKHGTFACSRILKNGYYEFHSLVWFHYIPLIILISICRYSEQCLHFAVRHDSFYQVRYMGNRVCLVFIGTPVQNSSADLWALFTYLIPGFLGDERYFRYDSIFWIAMSDRLHIKGGRILIPDSSSSSRFSSAEMRKRQRHR